MNLSNAVRVRFEPLRSLDWTLITANYVAVGSAFDHSLRMLKFSNATDVGLYVAQVGQPEFEYLAANSFSFYDFGSNKSVIGGVLEFPAHESFFVKAVGALPTTGKFYITAVYASNS